MEIGRKIYFDKATGNFILDTGERQGTLVIQTTQEQDFEVYTSLAERVPQTVGTIQLEYGQYMDNFAKYPFHIDTNTQQIVWDTSPQLTLEAQKTAKIAQLNDLCEQSLATFKSSALGTEHTYLSGIKDMILLSAEYSFVKGDDYDGSDMLWYTVEGGNLLHTKAQYVQMYLDGRASISTSKYRLAVLEANVMACTTQQEVDAIVW